MASRRVVFVKRPQGSLTEESFRVEDHDLPDLEEGQIRVQTTHISVDAYQRAAMNEGGFHHSQLGKTVLAYGVGRVVDSRDPNFRPGEAVCGILPAQTYATIASPSLPFLGVQKVNDSLAPLSSFLGALGITTGLTAYAGMKYVGEVSTGDVVVVSAAAGAVGIIAAQIAKLSGAAKVIGIAGGPLKTEFLEEKLGLDATIDYKNENVEARLADLAPDGVSLFFDNVGGETLDAVLMNLAPSGARVVVCGAISQYERMDNIHGPRNYLKLAEQCARMQGFVVSAYQDRFQEARADLARWLGEGKLIMPEDIRKGIDSFPGALVGLMQGENIGKTLVEI